MTSKFKQEQYDLLKRCSTSGNMSEWNSYRADPSRTIIYLDGADFTLARLEGAQLGGCSLKGALFEQADLLAADFRGADLSNANFKSANLWGATLSEANLKGACLVSANLENADLRKANLEQADLKEANLEGTIVQSVGEENLPGLKEEQEVIIHLAEDLTYRDVVSVTKSIESLSLIAGASLPHLNEIQISLRIENQPLWDGAKLDNMISVTIPRNVAEILPELFPLHTTSGNTGPQESDVNSGHRMKNSGARLCFKEFLAHAGFSENEQRIASKNLKIHHIEEDHLMLDLGIVTHLVRSERIHFHI